MLSVLIVDDEVITRKGLKSHIDWKKLNIDKIYDSGNAEEALEIVREYKPDLILSDVNMAGMNGIEMCRKIREAHCDCQIVFLSGYSDKEYLKGAIALEAVDYVEKPIDIEEVEEALERAAKKQIENKRKIEKMRRLVAENYSLMARRVIDKITMPRVKKSELEEDLAKLKLNWTQMKEFTVIMFKILPQNNQSAEKLVKAIRQEFRKVSHIDTVKDSNYLLFVCAFPDSGTKEFAEQLRKQMEKWDEKRLYCAVGEPVLAMEQIYETYQSVVVKMQQMRFWNQEGFIFKEQFVEKTLQFDEAIFKEFTKGLKQYKEEIVNSAVQKLYAFMVDQKGIMVSSAKGIYFRFIESLFQKAEFSVGNEMVSDAEIVGLIWEKLHGIDTLEKCQAYLREETEDYFKNVEELAESNQTIIMIISYIQANYQDADLCLENIAENVYLSQNYLSSLFKKKMGKTISQYIVDVRIENAKILLRNRGLKLYDVALQVGYKDANYFTKIFKKAIGITPSEYREKYN